MHGFDEGDVRRMLGETAQGIADGAPLPALSPAKGADEITHPLPLRAKAEAPLVGCFRRVRIVSP